jgi:hypothetical protein
LGCYRVNVVRVNPFKSGQPVLGHHPACAGADQQQMLGVWRYIAQKSVEVIHCGLPASLRMPSCQMPAQTTCASRMKQITP